LKKVGIERFERRGRKNELLDGLDGGEFERDLSLIRLDHLYGSFEILPTNVRKEQLRKSAGQK
jgi:hypothetical protein